jgi:hypothetical protein
MATGIGREMAEHLDRPNCITKHKMDNLWVCLAAESARCPQMIIYGPENTVCMNTTWNLGVDPISDSMPTLMVYRLGRECSTPSWSQRNIKCRMAAL